MGTGAFDDERPGSRDGRRARGAGPAIARRLRRAAVVAAVVVVAAVPAATARPVAAASVLTSVTSDGWSGYSEGNGPYTGVSGTFTVPRLAPTPDESFVNAWVGIDGIGPNSPLIQAGITELYDPNTATTHAHAWWQILPEHPLSQQIDGVGVRPGDRITVSIGQINGAVWQIGLVNDTTGAAFATLETYRGPRASADWIVEAPTSPDGTRQRLAVYSPAVTFSHLAANGPRTSLTRWTMVQGGRRVAAPSSFSTGGFSVRYAAVPSPVPPMRVETILRGQLAALPASGGVPYAQVEWQVSTDLVDWTTLTTTTLDGSGRSTYAFAPTGTAYYRARFSGTGAYGPKVIKVVVVQPSPGPSPSPGASTGPAQSPGPSPSGAASGAPSASPSVGPGASPSPTPAPGAAVTGTVLGPDGTPAAGLQVAAYRFPAQGGGLATTAADGTYAIQDLTPGTYRMTVSDPTGALPSGYVNGSGLTPYGPLASVVTVGADGAQVSVQVPAGETITGTVRARGRPFPGIHVFACGALDGILPGTGIPNCGTATSTADGTYSIAVLPGPYTVVTGASKPYPWTFYSTAGPTLDGAAATVLQAADTGVTGVDVALSPAPTYPKLTGRVTDARGRPLSGIFVDACATDAPATCYYGSAGPDGTYTIDLPAGSYTLAFDDPANQHPSGFYGADGQAAADGFTATLADAAPVTVGTNGTRGVDVQLPAGHLVSGTVTGPDGAPLANVQVTPCASPACSGQASPTGPDGSFTLDLASGSYVLHVTDWSGLYLSGYYAPGGLANTTAATPVRVGDGDVSGLRVAMHGIDASASPGVTRTGPFTAAEPVVASPGGYVTVRVAMGTGFAGSTVEIQVATRDATGQWSGFRGVTTRLVGADGCAYYFVRPTGWLAVRAGVRDPVVSALQTAGGLGDVEVFSGAVVLRGS